MCTVNNIKNEEEFKKKIKKLRKSTEIQRLFFKYKLNLI